ncbi:MAG: hypothetical protein NC122_04320 [Faecalibacterium sp.]|nr:hypothetical protein [Ruminococcus sp.]MCM1392880.1 hypothetical protein [Ruminococcus sp.]MCM1485409.1 hypothetical protein [Faecalibacterium sp.]
MKKYLSSLDSNKKTTVCEPKKNIFLGVVLCLVAPVCMIAGGSIAGSFGIFIGLLFSVAFVLAGIYQFTGVCETECPYCGEKVYIKKNAKNVKCRVCKHVSNVVEE